MTCSAQKIRKTQPYILFGEDKFKDTSTVLFGLGTATPLTRFHVVGDNTYSAFFMSGNVGIGTTMPAYTLDVNGTIRSSMLSGGNGIVTYNNDGVLQQLPFTGNASQVLLGNGTFSSAFFDEDWKVVGNNMYSMPSDNVGIGTNNPQTKLHVLGDVWITDMLKVGSSSVFIGTDWAGVDNNLWTTSGPLWLQNGINSDVIIASDGSTGKIGIGTSNPTEKLDVAGNVKVAGTVTAGGLDVDGMITFDSLQVNGNINALGVIKSGNSIYIDGTLNNPGFPSTIYADDNVLTFSGGTPSNPDLVILKVGIGTNNPVKKLHVKAVHQLEQVPGGSMRLEDVFIDEFNNIVGTSVWDFEPIGGGQNIPARLRISTPQGDGQVIIGDDTQTSGPNNNFKLSVDGKVVAKKYIATQLNWADDEFEKDLTLNDLEKEERHVEKNSHLEGIPSGKEVEKDGIDLAEMSGLQMRKIEQVFLYLFKFNAAIKQLKKKIKETADANNALRKENKHLRNELADLKKRVKVLERRFEK